MALNFGENIFGKSPASKPLLKRIEYFWSCPPNSFQTANPDTDAIIISETAITSEADGVIFSAPIILPDGANIETIEIFGNAGAGAETWKFIKVSLLDQTNTTITTGNINTSKTTTEILNNSSNVYMIVTSSLDIGDAIYAAKISYTLQPIPPGKTTKEEGTITPPPATCFLAGTKISMDNGKEKNIEDVEVGDLVMSFNIKENRKTIEKVNMVKHYKEGETADFHVIINKKLKADPDQFVMINKKWVEAQNLKLGDNLFNINGVDEEILSIEKVIEKVTTYDLNIANTSNYYAEGVLVHNACP